MLHLISREGMFMRVYGLILFVFILTGCGSKRKNPAPEVPAENLLKLSSDFEGGTGKAQVVQMDSYDGAQAFSTDLGQGCDSDWNPQGVLCDQGDKYTNSETVSAKQKQYSGATWNNTDGDADDPASNIVNGTGVLVIDISKSVSIDRFQVFQMFSDGDGGITQKIRFSIHDSTDDAAPDWSDAGWTEITDFVDVSAGQHDGQEDSCITSTADSSVKIPCDKVSKPTLVKLTSLKTTRYLRIEVRSPDAKWIELRSVKAYAKE
jgi:hypothetical protein